MSKEHDCGIKCTTAGELMEALSSVDPKLPIIISCMDGADIVWVKEDITNVYDAVWIIG